MPPGPLRSLVVDGVVAGVGTTLTFVPQIAILFFFLGVLEDTGYMSRAAFIMDRIMGRVGLSGRAFIPLLSSFACAIPGIMATRTIDNRRDRITTIVIAPFMSCSARLPVYALLIGAFIPNVWVGFITLPGIMLFSMYFLGILAAIVVASVLKRTVLSGGRPLYVMELPPYRMPSWGSILLTVRERSWLFIKNAGTVILAITVVLWFLASYPRGGGEVPALEAQRAVAVAAGDAPAGQAAGWPYCGDVAANTRSPAASATSSSPRSRPLGFDWRIGVALITSFAAREVMISTMATMFNLGNANDDVVPLRQSLRDATDPHTGLRAYTPLTALSLMVFFVLACQCMSTVAIVHRETNSWRWPHLHAGDDEPDGVAGVVWRLPGRQDAGVRSMSSELVQNALVALIVLAAAGFLVWRRVRARRKPTPFCGDCPRCATGHAESAGPALVNIARARADQSTGVPGPDA